MPKQRSNSVKKNIAPILHVFCEGEKTEPNYFNGYIGHSFPGNRRLKIEKAKKNTPLQLVEEALAAKLDKNCPDEDVFWVVFDRESEAKYSKELLLEAYQCGNANGINIALSNVCFEVWILLHFQKNTAAFSSYDDLRKNSDLCKTHIKNYDKGDVGIFDVVGDWVAEARARAVEMNKHTIASADPSWRMPYEWNPFCDVYLLLDAMDEFVKQV